MPRPKRQHKGPRPRHPKHPKHPEQGHKPEKPEIQPKKHGPISQ